MKPFSFICLIAALAFLVPPQGLRADESEGTAKEKGEWLEPFAHDYYWDSFTVSKETPLSPDGRFKLKKVQRNGDVELYLMEGSKEKKKIVVKPLPQKTKAGSPTPSLAVEQSDPKKQSAVLKELKMR